VERRAHQQLDAGEAEQLSLEVAGDDKVTVTDNGRWKPVEAHDVGEECSGDGRGSVGVAERDEVRELGEAIHHREDHRLGPHLWEALDEVHGYVAPYLPWHREGLQESGRVQVLELDPLAHRATPDYLLTSRIRWAL